MEWSTDVFDYWSLSRNMEEREKVFEKSKQSEERYQKLVCLFFGINAIKKSLKLGR